MSNVNTLMRLSHIPSPPMLADALGYTGEMRYVSFWKSSDRNYEDAIWYFDGQDKECVLNGEAWLNFTTHENIAPHLEIFDFGGFGKAVHVLIVDRDYGYIYVATVDDATGFLIQKNTPCVNRAAYSSGNTPDVNASLNNHLELTIDSLYSMSSWLNKNYME